MLIILAPLTGGANGHKRPTAARARRARANQAAATNIDENR